MVPTGNKAKPLSLVNHTTKTIHHLHHHHHQPLSFWLCLPVMQCKSKGSYLKAGPGKLLVNFELYLKNSKSTNILVIRKCNDWHSVCHSVCQSSPKI